MAATGAPDDGQMISVPSDEVGGADTTESKEMAGTDAESVELAGETGKAPVEQVPATTEQPVT